MPIESCRVLLTVKTGLEGVDGIWFDNSLVQAVQSVHNSLWEEVTSQTLVSSLVFNSRVNVVVSVVNQTNNFGFESSACLVARTVCRTSCLSIILQVQVQVPFCLAQPRYSPPHGSGVTELALGSPALHLLYVVLALYAASFFCRCWCS